MRSPGAAGSAPKSKAPEPFEPHEYQEWGITGMVSSPIFSLLLDPGLGKTAITLAAFKLLKEEGVVRRMLVIAPLRVCQSTWPDEIKKWTDFNDLKCVVLHGPKKEQLLEEDADVFLINPEGIEWLVQRKKHLKKWMSMREFPGGWPEMLVVDESTRFKHHGTNRFKALKLVLPEFDRRYILTGTPAPNGYHDLWGQYYLLDLGDRLEPFVTRFRQKFFIPSWDGFGWQIASDAAMERIQERIADITLRLDAEDYLDLPALIHKNIYVDLPPKARGLYEELQNEFLVQLREGEVTAVNAGVLTSKLRQVANGRVYLDSGGEVMALQGELEPKKNREIAVIHDAKVKAVRELYDELNGQPLLIAYEFRHDLDALRKEFGKDLPALGAGTSSTKGKKICDAWNRGEIPILLAHPASAGWGLNLQDGGHHMCWFSETWNLEHFTQLIGRQWRQGQRYPVFVYHVVAKHTIDATIVAAREEKDVTQQTLLDTLKKELPR